MNLAELGWDGDWQNAFSSYADEASAGRIVRVDRSLCSVLTQAGLVRTSLGGDMLEAISTDPTAAPCTGDWGVVRHWSDGPSTIEAVLTRRSAVTRADARGTSRGQVLAANVDVVAVVVALHPEPNMARIERFLSLAWHSGGVPVVVLTKSDAVSDAEHLADDVRRSAPGVKVVCTSTVTGAGLGEVAQLFEGSKTMVLLGVSGHGKSSLINALLGADVLGIKDIRADGKGRHTSVRRELLRMPGGGAVIDTPGLRGVGLQDSAAGIAATFPDVEALIDSCRFADCAHDTEPDCAIQTALADGTLQLRRLESWRALQREQVWMATRTDARLRSEQQQKWKQLSRATRAGRRGRP
ncbi:MAG: ribosome small subunit-dependent GTPase A [Nocardioidaceae bacterium]|nr:ribosome small subunit-dependent GTPase A [Nocardioidaceae bacterium]